MLRGPWLANRLQGGEGPVAGTGSILARPRRGFCTVTHIRGSVRLCAGIETSIETTLEVADSASSCDPIAPIPRAARDPDSVSYCGVG